MSIEKQRCLHIIEQWKNFVYRLTERIHWFEKRDWSYSQSVKKLVCSWSFLKKTKVGLIFEIQELISVFLFHMCKGDDRCIIKCAKCMILFTVLLSFGNDMDLGTILHILVKR